MRLNKNAKIIYELLEQELLNDELAEKQTQELDEQKEQLLSNTQVCEEEGYNFTAGKDMPQSYQCGGVANVGKYLRVAPDGYVRPMAGSGGGEGYEPDFLTIGLTSNSELAVMDYISYTTAITLLGAKQDLITAQTDLDVRNISVNNKVWFGNYYIDEPSLSALLETVEETLPEAIASKQDILTAGTGISIVNNVISATGGGSGEPVYVITGRAVITDPSSLLHIEIDITSPNYYSELRAFYDENGRLPRIVADIELILGTEVLRTVEIDMFANNVDSDSMDVQGSLTEENGSVSYIEFDISGTEQEGHLSSIRLQERLTTDSAIRVKEIHFPSGEIIDDNYLEKIVNLDQYQLITGQKIFSHSAGLGVMYTGGGSTYATSYQYNLINPVSTSGTTIKSPKFHYPNKNTGDYTFAITSDIVANPTDTATDTLSKLKLFGTTYSIEGGGSGKTYYLHTVSFETTQDNMHWQVGIINQSPSQFTDIQDFWTKIEKIVSIFGTPTNLGGTKEIYFNGAMAESGAIHVRGIDSNFEVKVKDISLTDVDWSSFAQFGIEEL